jgi:delta24-sterol reductase
MIPFSNHWLYRTLWGWMGAPEVSYLKLFQGPVIRKASVYAHVVQESIMPIRYLSEGITRFDNWYGVYPLLAFPLRVYDRKERSGFLHPRESNLIKGKDYGIWVDLGAYGAPRMVKEGKSWDAKKNIREMEHWTRDIGG